MKGAGGLLTEQRAVAVARCISSGDGGRSEIRSRAVLALANAASFPFSDGLRELVQVGVCPCFGSFITTLSTR